MNRWTPLTVAVLVAFVLGVGWTILHPSWSGLGGIVLACVFAWWLVVGCARRGEPLARAIVSHHGC